MHNHFRKVLSNAVVIGTDADVIHSGNISDVIHVI